MKKISLYFLSFILIVSIVACEKATTTTTPPPAPVLPKAKLMNLPAGWKYATLINASFPDGIELYFFDGLDQEEASLKLNITQSSFSKRLQRGLSKMKELLGDDFLID